MTLTECKEFMRMYQRSPNAVLYNWRTTARWALRHRWAQEENGQLRDALAAARDELASMTVRMQIAEDARQIETRRAERALDTLARYEQQQWMARAIGAEAAEERMLAERAPRRIEGTLPAYDLRRAFADGAAWWNFNSTGFTMFGSERREAEVEAETRYPNGKLGPVEVQP